MNHLKMTHGQVNSVVTMKILFTLCWIAYVTTYLGRLDYSACLVEIVNAEGWTKGQAGLIATGFFITYGFGQLVNGFMGDRLSPKIMVACGVGISGCINLVFPFMPSVQTTTMLWCLNGFVQSMIWSPLIRLLSEWMPEEKRLKCCVNMNGTVPVGTLAVYGISAGLVYLGNWRWVFFTSGIIMLLVSIIWILGISYVEKQVVPVKNKKITQKDTENVVHRSYVKLAWAGALPLCCVAIFMQGMLKDGVTTWIPTFLQENFGLTSAAAILSTTIVPIINLGGVYFASFCTHRWFKNEVLTATIFFMVGFSALSLLAFGGVNSAVFSLLLLATTTTFMMGINTLYASMMPSYYVHFGICSTITGILNSSAYVGCAVSSYGNGEIVELFGWNAIMYCWCVAAFIGIVISAFAVKRWKQFRKVAEI